MFDDLTPAEKQNLLKLVCAFAWADEHIQDEERATIAKLVDQLELGDEELREVHFWLQDKEHAADLVGAMDEVPKAHRDLFVDVCRQLIGSDDHVTDDEAQELALLEIFTDRL